MQCDSRCLKLNHYLVKKQNQKQKKNSQSSQFTGLEELEKTVYLFIYFLLLQFKSRGL